jgi:hypothetical protein
MNYHRNLTFLFGLCTFGAMVLAYEKYVQYGLSRFTGSALAVAMFLALTLHFHKKWKKY